MVALGVLVTLSRTKFQIAAWQGWRRVLDRWQALDMVLRSQGVRGQHLFISQGTRSCVLGQGAPQGQQ